MNSRHLLLRIGLSVLYAALLFGLMPAAFAQVELPPSLASSTLRIPLEPWVVRIESLDGVNNGYTDCVGEFAQYVGPVRNGLPHGRGKLTIECEAIPVGIGHDQVGETCIDCTLAREWVGDFRNGTLPFGKVLFADGSTYEGPLFDLVPHGEGIVTLVNQTPRRQTFRFGWPVPRLVPQRTDEVEPGPEE